MMNLPTSPTEFLLCSTISLLDILPFICLAHIGILTTIWSLGSSNTFFSYLSNNGMINNEYLIIYSALESTFYIYSSYFSKLFFDESSSPKMEITNESRRSLFEETLHSLNGKNRGEIDAWLKGWFYTLPPGRLGWMGSIRSLVSPTAVMELETNKKEEEGGIKRGNVEELLCGIFYNSALKEVLSDPIKNHNLISMIHQIEMKRNFKFTSGYNKTLKPLCSAHLLKTGLVKSEHRPLVFYLSMGFLNGSFGWIMYLIGFERINHKVQNGEGGLEGWYHHGLTNSGSGLLCYFFNFLFAKTSSTSGQEKREMNTENKRNQPIIFIPGLAGPFFLTHLILQMVFCLDKPILVVDQPHLSLSLRFHWSIGSRFRSTGGTSTSLPILSTCIIDFFKENGYELGGADIPVIVAHSLGSALASSLVQSISTSSQNKEKINGLANDVGGTIDNATQMKLVLLDPISILITDSHLSRIIYLPSSSSSSSSWRVKREELPRGSMNRFVQYFVREKGMLSFLINEFNPFDSFLPISKLSPSPSNTDLDLKVKVKVVLSRKDHLLPISEIEQYLNNNKNKVDLEILEGVQHGGWLINLPSYLKVWGIIKDVVQETHSEQNENQAKDMTLLGEETTSAPKKPASYTSKEVLHRWTSNQVSSLNGDAINVPQKIIRSRSKSFILTPSSYSSSIITRSPSKLSSSTSPLLISNNSSLSIVKMGRSRSKTVSCQPPPQPAAKYFDTEGSEPTFAAEEEEFSMSRQCSAIGMNRTLNVSRFKIARRVDSSSKYQTVGVWN